MTSGLRLIFPSIDFWLLPVKMHASARISSMMMLMSKIAWCGASLQHFFNRDNDLGGEKTDGVMG